MKRSAFSEAFADSLPVMAGYIVLGFGFGLLLAQAGYGPAWAGAMSLFIYAGSMQYVAVPLLTTNTDLLTAAVTTLAVNARHLLYGMSMAERYRDTGKWKPYLALALTDETYSIVCRGQKRETGYYVAVSALDHLYWVAGSVGGNVLGTVLSIDAEGMDFALTALFVATFTDQWLDARDHRPALVGVGASVLCLLIFGADAFLIPAMLALTGALLLLPKEAAV